MPSSSFFNEIILFIFIPLTFLDKRCVVVGPKSESPFQEKNIVFWILFSSHVYNIFCSRILKYFLQQKCKRDYITFIIS